MKSFKKIFDFFLFLLLAGFIWWSLLLFHTFPKKLYVNNPSETSESTGIVVLTGGKNRIEKGVDLLSKGYGNKLLISGVFMPSEIEAKFSLEKEKNELFRFLLLTRASSRAVTCTSTGTWYLYLQTVLQYSM